MENEKQAENFKIAISSTIKALAKKQDLNILFSDAPAKESNVINLPKISFDSMDEYWDGYYKGKMCQDGTYVWKLTYTDLSNKTYERVGHVNLIR